MLHDLHWQKVLLLKLGEANGLVATVNDNYQNNKPQPLL